MFKQIVLLSAFVFLAASLMSQPDSGRRNTAVTASELALRLPASLDEVSSFDGQLHFVTGGMLLASSATSSHLSSPMVDSLLVAIDPQLTYAVRDPLTKSIYYTKKDSKGVSQLFVYYEKRKGKFTSRRVKLPEMSSSVMHPVFSNDGRVMVFASDSPLGFGGIDLWFSMRSGNDWLSPQNMGHLVNSGGDDIMPAIYGNYLVFSSDGRPDSYGGFDLYATRLLTLRQGDTARMYPIGRSPVQSLKAPFCSKDDDMAFIPSSNLNHGWWLRRNADNSEVLNRFDGTLHCVVMRGTLTSEHYDKLDDAYVVAAHTPRKGASQSYDTARVLSDGSYVIFLQNGVHYDLSFHAKNHFVEQQEIVPVRGSEELLYADATKDVQLRTIPLDSLITFTHLFSTSVSSELSSAGRANVDKLVCFLLENPGLRINVYSNYNLSADIPFCSLLNGSRLRSLTDYLVSKGVNSKAITTSTNIPPSLKRNSRAMIADRSVSPLEQSSLTVAFSFSKF